MICTSRELTSLSLPLSSPTPSLALACFFLRFAVFWSNRCRSFSGLSSSLFRFRASFADSFSAFLASLTRFLAAASRCLLAFSLSAFDFVSPLVLLLALNLLAVRQVPPLPAVCRLGLPRVQLLELEERHVPTPLPTVEGEVLLDALLIRESGLRLLHARIYPSDVVDPGQGALDPSDRFCTSQAARCSCP